ncbi:methyltransferase [Streptomyces sp. WAC06614]|uniref:methyltransferase n=1 Tax=Streptomyces sp. WAC06614 TaxID=2487416 RepID=UPI0021AED118|nr:methyltransferase [Streptomyces sp. WAC06614]
MASSTGAPDPSVSSPSPLDDLMFGHIHSAALRAVVVHGVADRLAEGPRTAEDLARSTGTHGPSLRRVLRLLAVKGLFREDAQGAFALTEAGRPLRSDVPGSQHAAVLMITDPMMGRSAEGLPETVRTGDSAFEASYGMSFFEHLLKSPEDRAVFDAGMASLSGTEDERVAQSYPFPETARVVDVGGGRGGLLRAVLAAGPGLSGVLFDQPATVAENVLDHPDTAGRWRTEGGDFFTAVPSGGDIYVLKHILHDWSDEDCLRILGAIRRAAAPGARLLVVDAVLPEGSAPHPAVELDVVMLMAVQGRERTAAEFTALLEQSGFTLHRILPTPALPSIVEAVAV